jgi:putative peptidoglycan lipid II flippase
VAVNNIAGLRETFSYSLRLVFFVNIPAMVGLIMLREPIVRLLFQRGAFDPDAVRQTATALFFYSVGLWAFSGVRIVVSTFYALQDTKTPVKVGLIALLSNIFLSIVLMGPLRHGGLALATSLAMAVNLILLILVLKKRLGRIGARGILTSAGKAMGASSTMGVALYGYARWVAPTHDSFWSLFAGVVGSVAAGALVYGSAAYLLKCREIGEVLDIVKGGRKKKV